MCGEGVETQTEATRRKRAACRQRRRSLGAVSAAAHAPEASLLIEAGLLAFGSKEAAVPQLAEDSRALHRGLEPLEKALAVFTVSKCYIRQGKLSPLSPGRPVCIAPRRRQCQVYHSRALIWPRASRPGVRGMTVWRRHSPFSSAVKRAPARRRSGQCRGSPRR